MGKQTKKKNLVDKNKGGGKSKKGRENETNSREKKKGVSLLSEIYENWTIGFRRSES